MKITKLLFAFYCIILMSSCSKEFSETVVASWEMTRIETQAGCNDPDLANIAVDDLGCFISDGSKICFNFVISENGVAQANYSEDGELDTFNYTYTVNNDTEQITLCAVEEQDDCILMNQVDGNLQFSVFSGGCELVYIMEKQ